MQKFRQVKEEMANGKYQQWISPEGLLLIGGWAKDGLNDVQIARLIGISRSTLGSWKKKYPVISDTLKKGKEVVDRQVENALLKRALGYTVEEITEITDDKGKTSIKKVIKPVLPDVTAQIFWLKNRKADVWRDKREEIRLDKSDDKQIDFTNITDEELRRLAAMGDKAS